MALAYPVCWGEHPCMKQNDFPKCLRQKTRSILRSTRKTHSLLETAWSRTVPGALRTLREGVFPVDENKRQNLLR